MDWITNNFKGYGGLNIYYYKKLPKNTPVAVLQISHGMGEHAKRYFDLTQYLNSKGIAVYAADHPGHGQSAASQDMLGNCGPESFEGIMENMRILNRLIHEENSGIPVFLLGHSMGSFESIFYMQKYSDTISGCILSGTNFKQNPFLLHAGKFLAYIIMKVKGKDRLSKYLTDMVFVPYNIKFEPAETKFDWLSTDKKTVTEYVNCPYCGHNFTASFFYFLSKGLLEIYKDKNLLKIKKTLPIFIMYGSMDPVGEFGKGPKELYYFFIKNGYTTDIKSYEGFRHEIFNETNRTLAYSDLYDWLIKNIP